jgi:hypothetical protein
MREMTPKERCRPGPGRWRIVLLLLILAASGCASVSPPGPPLAMVPPKGAGGVFSRHLPVLVIHGPENSWNRVGAVEARDGEVRIDPDRPAVYVRRETFRTERGEYTNLVYRFHFEKVPFSLVPFHLTAGDNVGLLVIVTLKDGRPLLCTTVHTCGCYLAFLPFSSTPRDMLPPDWPREKQQVLGERLPAVLGLAGSGHVALHIRPDTHRVMDAEVFTGPAPWPSRPLAILPMESLHALDGPAGGESFFVEEGIRRGHVRGSRKPFEMLLMGWWALDPFVGEDKDLGPEEKTGTRFYTSLKFWARDSSNMADFARFLRYWGWRL